LHNASLRAHIFQAHVEQSATAPSVATLYSRVTHKNMPLTSLSVNYPAHSITDLATSPGTEAHALIPNKWHIIRPTASGLFLGCVSLISAIQLLSLFYITTIVCYFPPLTRRACGLMVEGAKLVR
jgi:hypothetical protein